MKPPVQRPIDRAEAAKAAQVWGLSLDTIEPQEVQRSFRLAIRAAHPDMGASKQEAADLIASARETRRVLLRWLSERPSPTCVNCMGLGYVRHGFTVRDCPRCGEG